MINYVEIREKIKRDNSDLNYILQKGITPYVYIGKKDVYFNKADWDKPTATVLFDLLHEIGHLRTNNIKMTRAEKEYYATVYAIHEAKKYKVTVWSYNYNRYQFYIDSFMTKEEKANRKLLTLEW